MKTVKKLFLGFVLAMVFSVTMIPIIWVFFSSFKSKKELMTKPWSLPEKFLFSNYSNAWQKADFAVLTKNSVTITAFSLLLMLVFATMLAFAISRYKGNLSQVTLIYLLAGQTISAGMIIFPIVIVLRKLGFGSSHAGLILTYAAGGLPFAVFVLQGFFAGIPYELYEAGEIDGITWIKELFLVVTPMVWPTLSTTLILAVTGLFNTSGPILLLTGGAFHTSTINFFIFNQVYKYSEYAYPAAIGLFFTLVSLPIVFGFRALMKKLDPEIEY